MQTEQKCNDCDYCILQNENLQCLHPTPYWVTHDSQRDRLVYPDYGRSCSCFRDIHVKPFRDQAAIAED